MKRILATTLAILMTLGMFAIGAGAIDGDEPGTEVSQVGEFDALTPLEKAGLMSLLLDFTTYMDKAQVEKAAYLAIALQFSQDSLEALKDPAKEVEFRQKVAAALGNVDLAFGDTFQVLIDAFLEDEEAVIVGAYKDGTLQSQLRTLFAAYLAGFIAEIQPLVDGYVKTEVLDAAKAYAKVLLLFWDIKDNTVWTTANKDALKKALNDFRNYVKANIKDFIKNQNDELKKFTAEINTLVNQLKGDLNTMITALNNARAKLKVIVDSLRAAVLKWWERLPGFLQWILKWLCFGWLWMRF